MLIDTGTLLSGRYLVERKLGGGGFGTVWHCTDNVLKREVAIKVLNKFGDQELLDRFRREAVILAGLRHPGITTVYDIGDHEGRPFIIMELLEGTDLGKRLTSRHSGLPVSETMQLAIQAAEALHAAHGMGVVHRDLKPGNLIVSHPARLKICGFGISRTVNATRPLTAAGTFIGTPAYSSPEQFRTGDIDIRSDIYSLGCVLYAMLTGHPPFTSDDFITLGYQHINVAPDLPVSTEPIPDALSALVLHMLAKDPAQRPTAGDLLDELGGTSTPDGLPKYLVDQPAESGQGGQVARVPGTGPEAVPRPAFVKSPADIARELRAARPGGSNSDRGSGGFPLRRIRARMEAKQPAFSEAEGYLRYEDLKRIHTAPEFARSLARLAAEAADQSVEPTTWATGTWPAGVSAADIEAVRAGRLIPSQQFLDAYLVSLGVSPDHLEYWHEPLRRVHTATAGVINLRTRAIQLARALDREHNAVKRRRSSNPLIRTRARMDARHADPNGVARASIYGQLFGEMVALLDEFPGGNLDAYDHDWYLPLPDAPQSLEDAVGNRSYYSLWIDRADGEHTWLESAVQGVKDTIKVLAAVQVDASGVDLRNLSLPERDAVIGVIWTPTTKWPDDIMDLIREPRSKRLRTDVFQVI